MQIGYFTEEPWVTEKWDPKWGTGVLTTSNGEYDRQLGAQLYNRWIDEKIYADEVGFDILMKNEHHSAPYCMQGVTNVEAAILARVTKKAKIFLGGNILPVWDDPLWLAEQLAMIDLVSYGRLISGWVRGVGSESYSHNSNPSYNRERFNEAHEFIVKTWTTPGPFRWEGKHYNYRYVNPWSMPYQQPHPPIWIPGTTSPETVTWAAERRYPYIRLSGQAPEQSVDMFELYHKTARECGYESGPQHIGYMLHIHVDETDEKAVEVGAKLSQGVRSPFDATTPQDIAGTFLPNLPGLQSAATRKYTAEKQIRVGTGAPRGTQTWESQLESLAAVAGTPTSVIPKLRHILEVMRPGVLILRTGEGTMTHEETMLSLKRLGEEVVPALKEVGKELGLDGPFEVDPATNKRLPVEANAS